MEKRIMGEGLNLKVPIAGKVIKVDVKAQPHPFREIGASSIQYQVVNMFDFEALCPHCEEKFKLKGIGLETKEFIQCPHCRRVIKLDPTDPEKKAIRGDRDFAD